MQAHSFLTHTPNPQIGSKGQNILFNESRHDAYQIVWNGTQSTMQTHILSLQTTSSLSRGERSNHFFSESSDVAYQINGNGAKRTMQAHIMSLCGAKRLRIVLLKVVMLHIKLKGLEHRAPFEHIVCSYTHPKFPDGVKTFLFLKAVLLHIKLDGLEH